MRIATFVARCEPGQPGIFSGASNMIASMDGTFDVPHIAPGTYCVSLQADRYFAHQTVTVSDRDLDNVTLTLIPAFQVKGTVVVEGTPLDNLRNFNITLMPAEPTSGGAGAQVQADGSFVLDNVQPLSYSLQYNGLPATAYVKSIRLGGRDVPDGRINPTSGADTLALVLATDTGQVTGSLRLANGDAAAGMVVVVAPAQSLRHDRVRSSYTDANGYFAVTGLAPGDYKVFAFEEIDMNSMEAAEYRQPFESLAASVTVHPSGHESVEVKMISADQAAEALKKLR
jgi:hypothetical protein